jgi:endonuclease-8
VPEGHTIYRQVREHNRTLRGQVVRADSPQGRFAAGAALIDGRTLLRAEAVGKHLFHQYDSQNWLHVHLGLYGEWRTGTPPLPSPRGALRLRLWTENVWWELRGATACEVLTRPEVTVIRNRLGPDPLRRNADPDRAYARIGRSRAPIAALLMDQSVLAGVGNVYRAELLFRHGIDPHRPGHDITPEQWSQMWADLLILMRDGVRRGRIVTTRPPHRRRSRVYVYRRTGEPCLVCGTPVRTEILLARNLFWCPACQLRLVTEPDSVREHTTGADWTESGGVTASEGERGSEAW